MVTKKPPSKQSLKQLRSDLAKLKRAGLYTGDVRRAKGGWRQKAIVKEYADVLSGKAKAVKVPKSAVKGLKRNFKVKNDRAIVFVKKGDTPRYTKKGITISRDEYGTKYKLVLPASGISPFQNLPTAPKGKVYLFRFTHGTLMSRDEFLRLLNEYRRRKPGIDGAVEIVEADKSDFPGLDDDEIEFDLNDYMGEDSRALRQIDPVRPRAAGRRVRGRHRGPAQGQG